MKVEEAMAIVESWIAPMSKRATVVEALRRAFAQISHHAKFTARIKGPIEQELPGYTVYIGHDKFDHYEVSVWGNGIEYNEAVRLSWYDRPGMSWQAQFEQELARVDMSDSVERLRDEGSLLPALTEIERQIAALRAKAAKMVASLPVPKSAKLRKDPVYWEKPSSQLAKQLPHLFGKD